MAALTAALITVNWGIYVWAIAVDRTIETALGYYINPLVSVVVGALLLSERLDRLQIAAVVLAAIAVAVLTIDAGKLPWVSLVLAFSFAAYAFFRKTLPIGPSQGFFLEVLLLSVPALGYIIWLHRHRAGAFRYRFAWTIPHCCSAAARSPPCRCCCLPSGPSCCASPPSASCSISRRPSCS